MGQFRKRPVEVAAVRWTGENASEIAVLTAGSRDVLVDPDSRSLLVNTLEGRMRCSMGDWLIEGVEGEFYPCKDSVFVATYEPIEEAVPAGTD